MKMNDPKRCKFSNRQNSCKHGERVLFSGVGKKALRCVIKGCPYYKPIGEVNEKL